MRIFDPERDSAREKLRAKVRASPPPLPNAVPGLRLAYRLSPKYTRSETAASFLFTGRAAIILGLLMLAAVTWFYGISALSGSCFALLTVSFALLAVVTGLWLVATGRSIKGVAHVPPPYIELDDLDLRPGVPFQLAFIQEKSARLQNVHVDLVCDDTVIESEEVADSSYEPQGAHVAGVHRNASGDYVRLVRTPRTTRLLDQRLIDLPLVDASDDVFEWFVNFEIPPALPPSGETADAKTVWAIYVDGTMIDGPDISERYIVRVRE